MGSNPKTVVQLKGGGGIWNRDRQRRKTCLKTGRRWPTTSQRERCRIGSTTKGTDPADTLVLDFQPPKVTFCLAVLEN